MPNKLKNLLNYGYIVVPVNLPGHWVLVVVNFARRLIQYFDSSGGGDGEPVDFNSISDNLPNVLATNVRHWVDSEYDESLKAYLAPTGLVSEPRGDLTCRGDLRLEVPKTGLTSASWLGAGWVVPPSAQS